MATPVRLLFFAGSSRTGSFNKQLARLGSMIAEANGIPSTFADLGDYPMPIYNADLEAAEGQPENAHKFKELMAAHSGIFIASPEYNASITPLLKNTIDWISRVRERGEPPLAVFKDRAFALGGASDSAYGAVRSLMALRQVLELGCGALVIPEQVTVFRASEAFDEMDNLTEERTANALKRVLQRLIDSARAMA